MARTLGLLSAILEEMKLSIASHNSTSSPKRCASSLKCHLTCHDIVWQSLLQHWTSLGLIGNGHYLGKAWCCSSTGPTALGTARGWWWERKDQASASFLSGTHNEERIASANLSECIPHAKKQVIACLTPPLLTWLLLACQSLDPPHLAQQHLGLSCKGCSMQLGGGSHMTRYPQKHTAVKVSVTGRLWLSEMGAGQPSAWSWEQEVWDGRFSASIVRWWWQTFLDGAFFFTVIFYCRAQCSAGTHTTSCFVSAENTCPCVPSNPACAVCQRNGWVRAVWPASCWCTLAGLAVTVEREALLLQNGHS